MSIVQLASNSPIYRIPCEILREIFVHCLPHYPLALDHIQPNTTIAPMLLCQICYSWRQVALEYPALWSHLTYSLTIINNRSLAWVLRRELEFSLFWKKNSRSIRLFLHLIIRPQQDVIISENDGTLLSSPEAQFLPIYLASAQYLKCDASVAFYDFQALVKSHHHLKAFSSLLHLSINDGEVPNRFLIPRHWFALTHISMCNATFSIDFWFSFIRSVPCLQAAYFDIKELTNTESYMEPATCTLYHLSSFFIYCYREYPNSSPFFEFPLSLLFKNLLLPNLHTLSTSSYESSWSHGSRGITELYDVLRSTPAVTTIALGDGFLPFGEHEDDEDDNTNSYMEEEKIWTRHAPYFTNLLLELPDVSYRPLSTAIRKFDLYLRNVLFKGGWLGLDAAGCPIKKITFVYNHLSSEVHFNGIAHAITLCIQGHAEKAPKVDFELISHSEKLAVSELH